MKIRLSTNRFWDSPLYNIFCRFLFHSIFTENFPGIYDQNPATGAYMLGDIVISLEKAKAQAEEFGHTFQREVGYLAVHSMLHLLGYDHAEPEEEKEMFGLQRRLLSAYLGKQAPKETRS